MCDDSTNDLTVAVACRQLGYNDVVRGEEIYSHSALSFLPTIIYCAGRMKPLGTFDVTLPNIPILLDDVKCGGDEIYLVNCTHSGFNDHNCLHYEDVVLECSGTT